MIKLIRKIKEIYKAEHLHFLFVDFSFYKKWKWIIRIAVLMNKKYVSCEIFRKKYKIHENLVIIGLKWNGKNVKRRTNGYAKEYLEENQGIDCIYCNVPLTTKNATSDHIVPISNGGNNCQVNIVICCTDCNNERGNLDFETYLKMNNINYKGQKHPFV